MIPAAAVPSLLLALAAGSGEPPAPTGSGNPFTGIPSRFTVYLNETTVLEIPPAAAFILSDYQLVEAVRVKEGVRLHGKRLGGAELFLTDGEQTESVTLSVLLPPPRQRDEQGRPVRAAEPDDLRLRTGGWISQGMLAGSTTGNSAQGFSSRAFSASLSGNNETLNYSLYGSTITTEDSRTSADVRALASGSWGRASFGGDAGLTEFRPAPWGQPYREGLLHLRGGDLDVEGGVRAPYRFDRLSFAPEALRGFAENKFGPAFLGVGVIGGGLDGGGTQWLPFGAAGVESRTAGASLFGGAVANAAAHIVGAEAHASFGTCGLSAQFTSGLRGRDAARVRDALQAYVDPNQDAFSSGGQCRVGRMAFSAGAVRGGTATPLVDPNAVLLSGGASFNGATASLFATGQWSTRGQDLRNFASMFGQLAAGKFLFSTSVSASRPLLAWNFNESATARRLFGDNSIGLSAGTSHASEAPNSGWMALDGQIQSDRLRASANVTTNVSTASAPTWNGAAQLEWFPFRAYALRAYSFLDLQHYRNWNVALGFSYQFGDDLPREPLLAPFRNHSLALQAFEDLDGDGKRGPNEPPLAGVKVCIDQDRCGNTDASGSWTADDLGDGLHRIRAEAAGVDGAMATTEEERLASVGSYHRPTVQFGFRRAGEIVVRAFVDLNGNGVRDPGEFELDEGSARISGPGLDTQVPLGPKGRATFYQKGPFAVTLDLMALPIGYAGPSSGVTVRADGFLPVVAEIPVRPLRSIEGSVCIDRNGNGACDPSELRVGFVRVSDGRTEAVTDAEGHFLLRGLGPGVHSIRAAEADLPAGTYQPHDLSVELGAAPAVLTRSLLLAFAPLARHGAPVEIDWPGAGRLAARLVGGYYFRPGPLVAARFVPAPEDVGVLTKLVRRARQGETRVSVIVYADAQGYREDREKALAQARATAGEIARWFQRRLPADRVGAEGRSPGDHEQVAEIRVYRAVAFGPSQSRKAPQD